MIKNRKKCRKGALFAVLVGVLFAFAGSVALATSVDRMWLNLEGYPGKTIEQEITLEGTDPGKGRAFGMLITRR